MNTVFCRYCQRTFTSTNVQADICQPCRLDYRCTCGCGRIVARPQHKYVRGHKPAAPPKPQAQVVPQEPLGLALSECKAVVTPLPSPAVKAAPAPFKRYRRKAYKEPREFSVTCQGCQAAFIAAHHKTRYCGACRETGYCMCGCGSKVSTPGRQYAAGHNPNSQAYRAGKE